MFSLVNIRQFVYLSEIELCNWNYLAKHDVWYWLIFNLHISFVVLYDLKCFRFTNILDYQINWNWIYLFWRIFLFLIQFLCEELLRRHILSGLKVHWLRGKLWSKWLLTSIVGLLDIELWYLNWWFDYMEDGISAFYKYIIYHKNHSFY